MACSRWKALSCVCRPGAVTSCERGLVPGWPQPGHCRNISWDIWVWMKECTLAPNYFPRGLFLFGSILLYCSWVRASSCSVFCLKHPSHLSSLCFWMLLRAIVGGSPSQGQCKAVGSVPPQHLVLGGRGCLGPCLCLINPTKRPVKKSSSGCQRRLRRKHIWIHQDESGFHFYHVYKEL